MANQVTTLKMGQKFKQAPTGEIPVDWDVIRLGAISTAIDGDWILNEDYSANGVRLLQVGDIGVGQFIGKSARFISETRARELGCTILAEDDILISRMPAPIGRACLLPKLPYPCITAVDVTIWRPNPDKFNRQYLAYYLNSPMWFSRAMNYAAGSTRVRISRSMLELMELPIPPMREQKKIAEILSAVDDAIEKITAVRAKIRALSSDLTLRLVYQGLGRKKLKESEIGYIPDRWAVVPLEQIATIERGKFQHRPRNEPRFYGGKYPFIQTGEVTSAGGRIRSFTQTLNEEGLAISKLFPKGTILITIAANIGETAIADFDLSFPDSLIGIVTGDEVDNRFLEYYLRTRKSHLNSLAPQSAQKNINLETLRPYPVPLPPKEEQVRIADVLDAFHEETLRTDEILHRWTDLKNSLMRVLLTGKRRVTEI